MEKQVRVRVPTNLNRQIALLAGPLVIQNVSQTMLGVADTFFVSRIGTAALAAVGLSSIMFIAVLVLFRGTAESTVIFVGRAHGEGDSAKIGASIWHSLNMVAWLSLAVLTLPWLFNNLMALASPGDSSLVHELGTRYLQIRAIEIPFVMFSGVVWSFLIGRGDSRTPMILAWLTVVLNIFLDWLLILGNLGFPALGVAGAAYATVMANSLNAILSAAILWSSSNRRIFSTGRIRLSSRHELRRVFKVGLPLGMGEFIEVASYSAFFTLIGQLGTDILAANQIALQYMSLSFMLGHAVNRAASSLVAQYLGAKQPDVAEKVGYRASLMAMLGMGVIGSSYLIAPTALIRIFSQEQSVIAAGVTILRLVALYQVLDAVGIVLAGALNGAGDTNFTMITRLLLAWGVFIPLVWVLIIQLDTGIRGAWSGALIYLGGLAIIYFLRFRSGRWKTIELA